MEYEVVATLGPTSDGESTWQAMCDAGVTGFRLNTSHLSLAQLETWVGRLGAFLATQDTAPSLVLGRAKAKARAEAQAEREAAIAEREAEAEAATRAATRETSGGATSQSGGSLPELLLFIRSHESGGNYSAYNGDGCEG